MLWVATVVMAWSVVSTPGSIIAVSDSVEVTVDPAVSASGSDVNIRVRINPHTEDRALSILVESIDYYRRSEMPLDGSKSASVHGLKLRNLLAGTYYVRATLERADEDIDSSLIQFEVVGPDLPGH